MPFSQERILGWPHPLPKLDQMVLSRLAESDDVIRGPHFSIASVPQPKSTTGSELLKHFRGYLRYV